MLHHDPADSATLVIGGDRDIFDDARWLPAFRQLVENEQRIGADNYAIEAGDEKPVIRIALETGPMNFRFFRREWVIAIDAGSRVDADHRGDIGWVCFRISMVTDDHYDPTSEITQIS